MATSTIPPPNGTDRDAQYRQLMRYTSIGAVIICPIIIALPPRKFDFYTVMLVLGTGFGANQVAREWTGYSLNQRMGMLAAGMAGSELPPKAREVQERLRVEREMRSQGKQKTSVVEAVQAAQQRQRREEEMQKEETDEKRLVEKIWMGQEGPDWKAKRDAREKEALEDGRGYWGLITEQIWEVWSWGKDKAEEIKEVDEKVVKNGKAGKGK